MSEHVKGSALCAMTPLSYVFMFFLNICDSCVFFTEYGNTFHNLDP